MIQSVRFVDIISWFHLLLHMFILGWYCNGGFYPADILLQHRYILFLDRPNLRKSKHLYVHLDILLMLLK
jgi:hypothetical protein